MGWLDEYYKALDKKKKEEPKDSWMDSYHSELSKLTAEQERTSPRRVIGTTASDNTPLFLQEKKESIFDGWFKKSEADSVSSAILGSGTDVLSDIGTGILGIGEKALDAFASLAPYAANAQFYQNGVFDLETEKAHKEAIEQSKKDIGEWVKKDLYDEEAVAKQLLSHLGASYDMTQKLQNGGIATEEDWKRYKQMQGDAAKYLDEDMEAHSVFDEKTDSLVQSAGQLAGTAALSAMGIPADVVIGLSSYGGEMENALKQGATYDEASFSSAVSAGAEILTEKISGGIKFGGKTLDDLGTKWLARNISNKALRTAANMGMQVIGEGAEEVASGFLSAVGQKLSYMDEKELSELFTKEDAWESFIGGAALGMGGSTIQTVNSAVNGVDSVTELTKNEQKVVDKVYKDELAKAEKNGKVTERQKAKIYDEVLEDMEKGYISTDTIEEVLGGERYEQYRKASEWEESLKQEFEELGKKENPTLADQRRFSELDKQLENVKATSTLEQMKAQLNKDVYEMTKGDRLVESYFENVRSKQKFEADLTKYEGKARDIIQKVMESKLADNSNQTHEFWNMAAQMAVDRDTDISIANDEQILELVKKEYEAEGKTFDASQFKGKRIDGYASKNGIVLNAQTKRALNFVLGHEITHTLEQSKQYKDLQKILFDYAKDEYRSRYNERAGQYKDIYTDEGYKAKMDKEVTADMVGDILFSDKDFVKHLSTENRNVFQKVWDEIKYFCKVATAGSKEARQLEKLKKTFEDVYRESEKAQGDGKYSISETTDGRYAAVVDSDILSNIDTSSWDDIKKSEAKTAAKNALKQFKDGIVVDGITRKVNRVSRREYTRSNYTESLYNHAPDVFADKMRASDVADDIVIAATNWQRDGGLKHPRTDDFVDFDRGKTLIVSGNSKYSAEVVVGITATGDAVFYDVVDMTPTTFDIKKEESPTTATTQNAIGDIQGDSFGNNVAQNGNDVKHSLSPEQQEYFKDSVVRDENGNLKVMYHGTPNGDFTVFKDGTYFTDNKEYADTYQNPGASSISTGKTATNPKTFEVYLDIKKPFDISDAEARNIYINDYIKGGNAMGINPYLSDAEYAKIDTIDWTEGEDLREFLIDNGYDYDGLVLDEGGTGGYGDEVKSRGKSYVVFSPEQVKNIDNLKPTSNPDIRFSLSEAVEETKDLMALHNLHSSELLKQLKMGGMAYPSIAITKPELFSHDGFGEVSVILHKDAIDPKKSKYNKIYSADAYTPTFPNVDYEASEQVAANITSKVNELYDKLPEYYQRSLRSLRDYTNIDDQLNRWGGEQRLVEKYADDYAMKQLYLAEKGEAVPVEKKTTETRMTDYQMKLYRTVADTIGEDVLKSFNEKGSFEKLGMARMAWLEKHGDALKNIYAEDWASDGTMTKEEALEIANEQKPIYWKGEIDRALAFIKTGGVTVSETDDIGATQAKIDEKIAGSDYKQWVVNLFSGIEGQSGIRNSKDIFTPSGNRRSFAQTHDPLTIDNIVRAMRKENQTGQGAFGGGSILGASAKEFGSIAEVKKNSGKLGVMDKAEHDAITDKINDTFWEIARRYANGKDIIDAQETIAEAVSKNESKAGIARYLKQYDYVYQYTDSIGDEIIELRDYIRSLPTPYFEAKPRRGVGFDEVGAFVIPYDADVKLKQELLNRGYAIAEYDPKVEGDRQRVVNQFEDLKFSLSNVGDTHREYGRWNVYSKYVAPVAENAVSNTENVLPNAENVLANATVSETESVADMFPDNLAPVQDEIERLEAERNEIYGGLETALEHGSDTEVGELAAEYDAITARIRELEADENQRVDSLTDDDVPAEAEAPMSMRSENHDPFRGVTIDEISRSTRSYSDLNPGARHFFEEAALGFLYDVNNSTHGERWYNDQLYYESGGEQGFGGTSRHTTPDIADLKDTYGYTWDELRTAAQKVADGDFRSVAAKRVEYLIHKRMMEGYTDVDGRRYEPNQDYISFLNETFANEQRAAGVDNLLANAPEDIAPVKPLAKATPDTMTAPLYDSKAKGAVKGQQSMFEPPKPNPKVATVLTEESAIAKEKSGIGMKLTSALVDKGMVFESLSLKTGNHELQAKWNYALPSNTEARAQYTMEHGASGVKSLKDIQKAVDKSGKADDFSNYLYHVHNIDRMTLEDRFDVENKTVFGETVTADVSRRKVAQYEKANPMFKDWAEDVYAYNRHLRNLLVEGNVISQDTADLWEKRYPHYVPIRRVDAKGQNISVPLDTNKTGVHNPIKKATGGNSDIQPVFATMAQRTEQTYRAIARNAFGIELKNTLGSTLTSQKNSTGVDETIDMLVAQEDHLLKPGTQNSNPTFTVFEDGERVEFEITEDMLDALKPAGGLLGYRNKAVGKVSEVRRNMLTTWNPVFALYRNPIKDMQDVAVNSQHAVKTYLNVPNAIYQIATGGKYAQEYHQNGGKSNTYFDSRSNEFKKEDNIFKKTIGMPIRAIETAGEFIEEIPRLAEYIASRQEGRSVERSMLDAARVTTNFAAGGDFTKLLNSHGFTFLNASVQGASQHVRNIREAKQQGLKGWTKLVAKYTIAGLPTVLLNGMLWDDDEEYEELNDYVKQNYYVVAKTEDGKFVRIPKGRTAAVMGELMNQMQNLVTGDDEADFGTFYELFWNNIAPNNPVENNILAPIGQVMTNRAWYGDELVPSRLQKLPDVEQFDESTDSISKWLGEKTNTSPYKWNYLLDQYSGGLGDVFLPMLTPEAESGDDTFMGNVLAPWKKEITTDKVLNNKNPGDFYDLKDELEKLSNSRNATEEDSMRSMYMDSVSWEMGDLYAQKREIQSSDLSDSEKYEKVRELQEQINELAKTAMEGYNDVSIDGLYSEVGDRRYNKDAESGKWYEIREKNSDGSANYYYQKEQNVTKALGISYGEYWNNREEYDYAYDKPEQYALAQAVGGYDSYRSHTSELWDIKADKDENGKSINGSRKDKIIEYLNELDIDYYHKIILFKNEYNADDTYNDEIIEYLNGRDDISYQQMESILKYLGFDVDSEGNISWD